MGKQYDKQFKQNAVAYRFDHPDLTIKECAAKLGVPYTASAKRDIRGIYEYVAYQLIEPDTAADLVRRILSAVLKLDENPERYKVYDEDPWRTKELRRFPVDNYEVFYVVNADSVNIVRIMFGGMDIGEPNPYGDYFVGQSYLAPVSTKQIPIYNVTFEPACRNNWHIHHAKNGGGQMLICVGGRGWYQEYGKEPRKLNPGDIVNIPANVKHWHGAANDSWFAHLAIEIQGEEGSTEWCEPVSDDDYNKLK